MGWLGYLIGSRSATLVSALSPSESVKRLREAVPETEGIWGSSPVVGWTEKDQASFSMRASSRNSLRPVLRLRWEPGGEGTVLQAKVGLGPGGVAGAAFCGVLLIGAWVAVVGQLMFGGPTADEALRGAAFLVLFSVVMVGLVVGGRMWSAGDERLLMDFVRRTLEAEVKA